jgi:FAD/FMN-containing dehydrogenase
VYSGDPAEGQPVVDRFRALATPIADLVGPMPYGGIYQFSAEAEVPVPAVTRSIFTDGLDTATLESVVAQLTAPGRPDLAITQIRVLGGEMGRVPADASAFAHRDAKIMFSAYTMLIDPERAAEHVAWTDTYFATVMPLMTGSYVNFLDLEGDARIRDAYPEATYRRLAELKRRWDPENVLHRNQNVRPA